jgi:hypothetical protein
LEAHAVQANDTGSNGLSKCPGILENREKLDAAGEGDVAISGNLNVAYSSLQVVEDGR